MRGPQIANKHYQTSKIYRNIRNLQTPPSVDETMSKSIFLSFPSPLPSPPTPLLLDSKSSNAYFSVPLPNQTLKPNLRVRVSKSLIRCRKLAAKMDSSSSRDCIGTGSDVECVATEASESDRLVQAETSTSASTFQIEGAGGKSDLDFLYGAWDWMILISPFFFWGTAMVAMKEVLPKAGPFFVSAFRLIPAGAILIGFAVSRGRKLPSGIMAWVWILLFGAVDAACFQGFLAEGLQKTSAGLGSVIIDSQPLTVAILAALLRRQLVGEHRLDRRPDK